MYICMRVCACVCALVCKHVFMCVFIRTCVYLKMVFLWHPTCACKPSIRYFCRGTAENCSLFQCIYISTCLFSRIIKITELLGVRMGVLQQFQQFDREMANDQICSNPPVHHHISSTASSCSNVVIYAAEPKCCGGMT